MKNKWGSVFGELPYENHNESMKYSKEKSMDYKNGEIYIIRSKVSSKIYIGSTVKGHKNRFKGHNKKYIKWANGLPVRYCASFILLEMGPCEVELIEKYPCDYQGELLYREQHYIDKYRNQCVNICDPWKFNLRKFLKKMDTFIKQTKADNFITDLDDKFNELQQLMQQ